MSPEMLDLAKELIGAVATIGGARMIATALKKRLDRVETVQEKHAVELAEHRIQLAEHAAHHAASDERLDVVESAVGLVK